MAPYCASHRETISQRTPWGGGKKSGVENLTTDTPPKKGFWTFSSPQVSVLCLFCTKIHDRPDQKLFWRGSKIFGRACSLVRFPPPIRFAPPHFTAQFLSDTPPRAKAARYGVFGVSIWPIGCDTPPPFLSSSPLESMQRREGAIPSPQKGYLSDTCAIPYENKANGCDTPLCDTISKGCCAICGGISHWAAKKGGWV